MNLQVRDTRKKIMVILTFLVGLIGTICSIIRLKYLTEWGKLTNVTMHYTDIAIWSAVEGDVGVICACMPAIMGPVLHYLRKFIAERSQRSRSKLSDETDSKGFRGPSSLGHSDVDTLTHKKGVISKTVVASMYNIPNDGNSDDDVELVSRNLEDHSEAGRRTSGRPAPSFGHEYAGSWR